MCPMASEKTGRSPHRWVLKSSSDRMRIFRCERCDAGPVQKVVLSPKGSIASEAKRQGFSADCNMELVKRTMEE